MDRLPAWAAAEAARGDRRVRADADKMPASFRAEAAQDRDELRTDLRARAERQADAYRDELDQLRSQASHDAVAAAASRTLPRQPGYPAATSPYGLSACIPASRPPPRHRPAGETRPK